MSASIFDSLQPTLVWSHFETLCRIPRPSKHEAALRAHLIAWAEAQGLPHEVDAVGNLLIRKPATPGHEAAPGVVLQGHLDMVTQARRGVPHDFMRDPIDVRLTHDGWLEAPDTTLGADNGLGVALALAVLEDTTLTHGPIEALFTVDEEAGMGGVKGLQTNWLDGRLLLNLDTEEWGEFYMGCAGGLDVNVEHRTAPAHLPAGSRGYRLTVEGLRGGHSGINIHEGRGNAIKLIVRLLQSLQQAHSLRLIQLTGGSARNALPRDAQAVLAIAPDQVPDFMRSFEASQDVLRQEWAEVEPQLRIELCEHPLSVDEREALSTSAQAMWLNTLHASPHGVQRLSQNLNGVVETSNNLGMVELHPSGGHCNYLVRSLRDSAAQALADEIVSLWAISGVSAQCSGHYPGWTPDPHSKLLATCLAVYKDRYQHAAGVQVIHAGLECGLLGAKYPDMDMVSFGPTIRGAHAPGERVEVTTVAQCWDLLTAILAHLAHPAS